MGRARWSRPLRAADPRPRALVSASAVGYYGSRGDERLDEDAAPGDDFLAEVCIAWEREANAAAEHGVRVVTVRTGVVLDKSGGALKKMLPPFKLGVGGPVAGGRQYLPWIHIDDLVGIYVAAIDNEAWSGPVNASAPEPVTNAEFSKALGRALHRPAFAPVPAFAIRALYGDMAEIVTEGQRAMPRRAARARLHVRAPGPRRGPDGRPALTLCSAVSSVWNRRAVGVLGQGRRRRGRRRNSHRAEDTARGR